MTSDALPLAFYLTSSSLYTKLWNFSDEFHSLLVLPLFFQFPLLRWSVSTSSLGETFPLYPFGIQLYFPGVRSGSGCEGLIWISPIELPYVFLSSNVRTVWCFSLVYVFLSTFFHTWYCSKNERDYTDPKGNISSQPLPFTKQQSHPSRSRLRPRILKYLKNIF